MILVTGASGLLGGYVLEGLAAQAMTARALTRGVSDWRDRKQIDFKRLGIDIRVADIFDADQVRKALEGCNVVINLVGSLRQPRDVSYSDLHVGCLRQLVDLSQAAGVQRFIHVSCLGASSFARSEYLRTKWEGEEIVKKGGFYWTIFRPSFMFCDRFPLFEAVEPVLTRLPFLPLFGGGMNEIQPVWVADVAACVIQSIYKREAASKVYEVAGPKPYRLAEIMSMFYQPEGAAKPQLSIPSDLALRICSLIVRVYPGFALSPEMIEILTADSTADPEELRRTYQVSMMSVDQVVKQIAAAGSRS